MGGGVKVFKGVFVLSNINMCNRSQHSDNVQVKVVEGNSLECIVNYSFLQSVYTLSFCQFHAFELTSFRPFNPST